VGLPPSFVAMEAGTAGNTQERKFKLGGGVNGVSEVEPFVLGVSGLGCCLAAGSHRAERWQVVASSP
jgi:hypothetical protein